MDKIGLYIHVPFCKSKCPYCDFYSLRANEEILNSYTKAVIGSIENWSEKTGKMADTLYLGGGTPSILGGDRVSQIIKSAKENFLCDGEITVECNPSQIEADFFKKIGLAGANRVSLGMQSAVDSERKSLGRIAGKTQVEAAIESAVKSGIDNISLDVMLGIPNQSEKSFDETLKFCVSSGVTHISAYMLKLEEGTYFFKNADKLNLPDDDFTADLYLKMVDFLECSGFSQYEISNFSKKGFESKHNLKYWNCCEYLGIGPSAHSFFDGKRFYYPRSIDLFLQNEPPIDDGFGGDLKEYVMLKLRLRDGLDLAKTKALYPEFRQNAVKKECELLENYRLLEIEENHIKLTPKGFLISNSIIEKILENC